MDRNPFDDGSSAPGRPANPFGEDTARSQTPEEAAGTIEYAAARIRRLKQHVGAEGLSLSATRELIDQLSAALDAAAGALRGLKER
jgi:hypothetical protein